MCSSAVGMSPIVWWRLYRWKNGCRRGYVVHRTELAIFKGHHAVPNYRGGAMSTEDDLRQDDIGFLFSLGDGELRSMPMVSAVRLMAWDLIEPIIGLPAPLDGAKVTGMKDYSVGITRKGIGTLIAVRSGDEARFFEPRS